MTNTTAPQSLPTSDSAAIRQIIRALRVDGWSLETVNDGGDTINVTNEREAIAAITAVDQAWLYVSRDEREGWVMFVLGNDPEEVAADWTVNLTAVETLTDAWISLW